MAHITAGDITALTYQIENEYGTPTGTAQYYADVAEGGKFKIEDNSNPYLAWRYGSRSFDPADYVTQQIDAAYSDVIETTDRQGWQKIIEYATGIGGTFNDAQASLPSRTTQIYVQPEPGQYQGRIYYGCKTDSLTIKADAPGGIVTFEEHVLASYPDNADTDTQGSGWAAGLPAVQWLSGATIGSTQIYPQSFSISIVNNLGRSYKPRASGAITGALLEGRREITAEFDLWMEDLDNIRASIANGNPGDITLTLGITNPVTLRLTGVRWMANGDYPDLIQDKQRETLRFRVQGISLTTPSTATLEATPGGAPEEPTEEQPEA